MGIEVNGLNQSIVKADSLETPVTPDSNKETMVMNPLSNNNGGDSPRTPKDTLFNPFSPGSERLLNAPIRRSHCEDSHGKIFRGLIYGLGKDYKLDLGESDDDGAESEDERLLVRDLYGDLLEVIAYGKAEEVLAAFPDADGAGSGLDASPSTDSSLIVFSGIAEICPSAPMKVDDSSKSSSMVINGGSNSNSNNNNSSSSLCKKLEF